MNNALVPPESRWRLPWAFVPVVLLVSSALGVGGMAVVAVRDPNFATESDYYQKALRWDQTQAQAAENQRLNYRLMLPSSVTVDRTGRATVEVKLLDQQGLPVQGAAISGEAFANAYSGDIHALTFSEHSPGVYAARLTARQRGVWIFRLTAQSGAAHFTADLRADLIPGGAA